MWVLHHYIELPEYVQSTTTPYLKRNPIFSTRSLSLTRVAGELLEPNSSKISENSFIPFSLTVSL